MINREPLQSNILIREVFHDNVEDLLLIDEYNDQDHHCLDRVLLL